ncbi:MAG: DegV family protein [Thermoflexales bacterium]
MTVRIITDTNADIDRRLAEQLGVDAIVSTYVIFGEKTFRSIDLTPAEFYAMLKSDPNFPKTSQPSIGDCAAVYERFKGEEVLSIHISRELSGTIASAEAAAAMMNGDPRITIIDTRQVSAGQALLVLEAVKMAKQGARAEEIKSCIESLIPRTRVHFVLETLENLRRGGRIGGAQALLGTMLQMKPILTIKDGRVEPLERVRTFNKAVERLKEIVVSDLRHVSELRIFVLHAAAPQLGEALASGIAAALGVPKPMMLEIGPTIATHVGPGAVGVGYIA